VRAGLRKNNERPKVLFGKLMRGSGGSEIFSFNVNRTANFESGCRYPSGIGGALVSLLRMVHLFMQELVE